MIFFYLKMNLKQTTINKTKMTKLFSFDITDKSVYNFSLDDIKQFNIDNNQILRKFLGVTQENEKMLRTLFDLGFFDNLQSDLKFFNFHYVMLENWLKNWRVKHIENKYLWRLSYEMTKNNNLYEYVSDNSTMRTFFYDDNDDTTEIMNDYILKMK